MRKIVIIIAVAISLMSTKCGEEPVNIIFDNTSDLDIVFSSIKNTKSLKIVISEKSYLDSRFKYLKRNSKRLNILSIAELY